MKLSKTLSKGRDVLESKMVRERENAYLHLLLFIQQVYFQYSLHATYYEQHWKSTHEKNKFSPQNINFYG